jgi:hypothetical protein
VPSVGVCIGGGNSSFLRVLEMAKRGMPVLLVKGSGGAADLMSDLVGMLRGREEEGKKAASEDLAGTLDEFPRMESAPPSEAALPQVFGEGRHYWESEEKMKLAADLLLLTEGMDETTLCKEVSSVYGFKSPLKCAPAHRAACYAYSCTGWREAQRQTAPQGSATNVEVGESVT